MRAIFASRHVDRSVVDGAGGGKINLYLNFHINFPSCSLGWSFLSDDEVTLLSALLLKTCTMQSGNSIRTECDFILSRAADDDMKLKFKKMFPSGLRRTTTDEDDDDKSIWGSFVSATEAFEKHATIPDVPPTMTCPRYAMPGLGQSAQPAQRKHSGNKFNARQFPLSFHFLLEVRSSRLAIRESTPPWAKNAATALLWESELLDFNEAYKLIVLYLMTARHPVRAIWLTRVGCRLSMRELFGEEDTMRLSTATEATHVGMITTICMIKSRRAKYGGA